MADSKKLSTRGTGVVGLFTAGAVEYLGHEIPSYAPGQDPVEATGLPVTTGEVLDAAGLVLAVVSLIAIIRG